MNRAFKMGKKLISKERYSPVSDSRIWFFTSVLRRPTLGFDFSRVFCAVRLSDLIFHGCFVPSDSRIRFFTSVLCCPNLGFDFSWVFYVVPTWDGVPLPLLRPRVDAAGAEWVRKYLKQRFVPGVGVCFLLVFFVEVSAFRVA